MTDEKEAKKLSDVDQGNAFEHFPNVGGKAEVGIKVRGVSIPEAIPILPIDNSVMMAPLARVIPICHVEYYDVGKDYELGNHPMIPVEDAQPGWYCLSVGFGLHAPIVVTGIAAISGVGVHCIRDPITLPFEEEVNDLCTAQAYFPDQSDIPVLS